MTRGCDREHEARDDFQELQPTYDDAEGDPGETLFGARPPPSKRARAIGHAQDNFNFYAAESTVGRALATQNDGGGSTNIPVIADRVGGILGRTSGQLDATDNSRRAT